ncbi:hypothetical protein LO772_08815 [Yinghuangia sp. ASG 101]|uniref:hypothetical protein n=1 Tax=Yinghuangia sp. ASG 101 TaxID=2896848 RepID=UPI001E32D6AB|nr:hypothetical protein [Yinghuangia sp. ASG 101]UGQ13681.1 hypothetical protein LO772_08815 [Yinghuangia sp. ASG 101]
MPRSTSGRVERRLLVGGRLALVVLAVGCGFLAAGTEDGHREVSDAATVAMLGFVVLLFLTGLYQPADPEVPEMLRRRARARRAGRRARAAIAAAGVVALGATLPTDDSERLATWGLLAILLSPLALPAALLWWRATASAGEVAARQHAKTGGEFPGPAGQPAARHRPPRPFHELLVAPGGRPPSAPVSIRPRPHVAPGGRYPWGLGAWLRNAVVTVDAATVSVTDATGRVRVLPRVSPATPGGVARIAICREDVRYHTRFGWSAPQRFESLTLLDSDLRRLLDLHVYGWTRDDLRTFATASGLGLERFWYDRPYSEVPGFRGLPPTPLKQWLPPGPGYDEARGAARWPKVLGVTAAVIGAIALLTALGFVAFATHELFGGPAWVGGVVASVLFTGLIAAAPRLSVRVLERVRARTAYQDAV